MVIGQVFPKIMARTLAGSECTLPDDVAGNVALIAVFTHSLQARIDAQVRAFEETSLPEIVIFRVPLIDSPFWKLLSGIVDAGMRNATPPEDHDHVVTFYGDAEPIRRSLGVLNHSSSGLFLLDRSGTICWEGNGEGEIGRLIETARDLSSCSSPAGEEERCGYEGQERTCYISRPEEEPEYAPYPHLYTRDT